MRRIAILALTLLVSQGCATITVNRRFDEGQKRPVVTYSYRKDKMWAWEIVNSYRWNPWPHLDKPR